MTLFPHLFSPAKIGGLELRNRLIMSLYPTKYPADGGVNDRYVEFWRARADWDRSSSSFSTAPLGSSGTGRCSRA